MDENPRSLDLSKKCRSESKIYRSEFKVYRSDFKFCRSESITCRLLSKTGISVSQQTRVNLAYRSENCSIFNLANDFGKVKECYK